MFYVYKITNKINGKVYIGKTNDPKKRWHDHLLISRSNKDSHLFSIVHAALNKYGVNNFSFEIIQQDLTEEQAFEREIYYILQYRSNIVRFGNYYGYNLTDGGEGQTGYKHTKQSIKKMSLAKIGKRSNHAKLNDEQVSAIICDYNDGVSQIQLAKEYKVCQATICKIVNRIGYYQTMVNPVSAVGTQPSKVGLPITKPL